MNSLKKIILMCLIPAVLTILFIVQFTIPSVNQYMNLNKQIKSNKILIKNLKNNLAMLEGNKVLAKELDKLNTDLIAYDIEFPAEFRDEILLIDMEVFSNEAMNRIVGLQSTAERELEIIDPSISPEEKKKKRRGKEKKLSPVQIIEKPFEINTVAYYNEIIDFVTFLENYQRKVNINGITAKIFDDDADRPNPRIHLTIAASTYKSIINKIEEEKEDKNEQKK